MTRTSPLRLACFAVVLPAVFAAASASPTTLEIRDFVELPITGKLDGKGQTDGMLARVNALREEPGGANRLFVHDLNGPLYLLDKASKKLSVYLDFNGREGHTGLFHRFAYEAGYANGLVSLQFDPDYRRNGRFYTVHIEDPSIDAPAVPDAASTPGLDVRGYEPTKAIATPGEILRDGVLIEWTDTNIGNATFEGSARELMRVQLNTRIHPLGDLVFNPAARSGDTDWRVLYVGCGDGGSGESRQAIRTNPQRLDTMVGKIHRIIPDLKAHESSSVVSENGRYRVPNDNPFVATPGARPEIWAYGFRNPHRLTFAIDPQTPANNRLIANSIGLHTWETVNIVHKGANYGYSMREGTEALQQDNKTTKRPDVDEIPVRVTGTVTNGTVVPHYPVSQYGHVPGGGDAIGSGYLYRGKALPALQGKYVFSDISTGRIWYADYREMLAADAAQTQVTPREVKLQWDKSAFDTMFPIVGIAYHTRGGKIEKLPGRALVSGEGRADAQFAVDAAGELYILTKTDGTIRAVVGTTVK